MIPFNLQKALDGAPLMTRDGRPATLFHNARKYESADYPYDAVIEGKLYGFTQRGTFWIRTESPNDLFMDPEAA